MADTCRPLWGQGGVSPVPGVFSEVPGSLALSQQASRSVITWKGFVGPPSSGQRWVAGGEGGMMDTVRSEAHPAAQKPSLEFPWLHCLEAEPKDSNDAQGSCEWKKQTCV